VPAAHAPIPAPAWPSARQTAGVDQVTPLRPPRRCRSRATGVASVPPTGPRPATRQRPPGSSPHSRSKPQPGAGPAPVRPSRRRSSRHPADISPHQDYRGHLRAVRRTARHHPIKFNSCCRP
jgi:hypothetical protein